MFPTLPRTSVRFMFAVVDIAGFQEKVKVGDTLAVPLLSEEPKNKVTFSKVLLLVGDKGEDVTIGAPYIDGASVEATVLEHGRHAKVRTVKMKRRKRYTKTIGHRQHYTTIEVTKIVGK